MHIMLYKYIILHIILYEGVMKVRYWLVYTATGRTIYNRFDHRIPALYFDPNNFREYIILYIIEIANTPY